MIAPCKLLRLAFCSVSCISIQAEPMRQPVLLLLFFFSCMLLVQRFSRVLAPLQEGMIALWRGWLPSVIGVIPYVGLNFSVYETLKDVTLKHYGKIFALTLLLCHFPASCLPQTALRHRSQPPLLEFSWVNDALENVPHKAYSEISTLCSWCITKKVVQQVAD